jgi:hypothetical protein
MNAGLNFNLTRHFCIRLTERHLNADDVKAVVRSSFGQKFLKRGIHGGKLSRFSQTEGGRTLVVIAEIKGGECWIATAYYEN